MGAAVQIISSLFVLWLTFGAFIPLRPFERLVLRELAEKIHDQPSLEEFTQKMTGISPSDNKREHRVQGEGGSFRKSKHSF